MSAIDKLIALLERCGATMTFDSRRYARAAKEWPDHLPPMFGEAAVAVERWGMNRWRQWEARAPDAWPAPTVAIGEDWEARNASATWAEADDPATAKAAGLLRVRVARLVGEQFISESGTPWPMTVVDEPTWRRAGTPGRPSPTDV